MLFGLLRQAAEFIGRVGVVIAVFYRQDWRNTERVKHLPERPGVAQTAESNDALGGEVCRVILVAATELDPLIGEGRGATQFYSLSITPDGRLLSVRTVLFSNRDGTP